MRKLNKYKYKKINKRLVFAVEEALYQTNYMYITIFSIISCQVIQGLFIFVLMKQTDSIEACLRNLLDCLSELF